MAVKGLQEAMRELNRQIEGIEERSRSGLLQAALFIESEAVPMTPVDTGSLRGSAFTDVTAPGVKPIAARVGYTAPYAPYVHEMTRRTGVSGPRIDRTTAAVQGPRRPRRARKTARIVRGRSARRHTPWAPGTGPKFLQRAVMENTGKILRIIRTSADAD